MSRLSPLLIAVLLACGACSQLPQTPKVDLVDAPARPEIKVAAPVVSRPTGGLFQQASYRPAFENRRARMVGDTLTVNIIENIAAAQSSTSDIARTGGNSAGITGLPLMNAAVLGKLAVGATSSTTFAGKGDTASTNTFTGTISATVVEVLPNGHLIISGEKQVGVNQNVDVLRFSGTVDPRDIQLGNVVSSTQVADARILSRGRGAQQEAQQIGWLSRIFLNVLPF